MEKRPKIKDNLQDELNQLRQKVAKLEKIQAKYEKTMKDSLESESRFRSIFENANDGIILHDTDGQILDVNQAMYKRLGYTKKELLKMNLKEIITPEYGKKVKERMTQLEDEGVAIFESADQKKDGSAIPVEVNARYIKYKGQKIIQSVVRDITDRKMAEDLIIATLKEKDLIFGEIQNRTKIITEIFLKTLDFFEKTKDIKESKTNVIAAKKRIKSMAYIQSSLYRSPSFASIDMTEATKNFAKYLYSLYKDEVKKFHISQYIKDVRMDLDRAFHCLMLINEFVSNSIRHAFPDKKAGEIEIKIRKNKDEYNLTYRDNGVGVEESLNLQRPITLGKQIIQELVNQLDGKIAISSHNGTEITVNF